MDIMSLVEIFYLKKKKLYLSFLYVKKNIIKMIVFEAIEIFLSSRIVRDKSSNFWEDLFIFLCPIPVPLFSSLFHLSLFFLPLFLFLYECH